MKMVIKNYFVNKSDERIIKEKDEILHNACAHMLKNTRYLPYRIHDSILSKSKWISMILNKKGIC